jgi:hypothetical protein
MGTVSAASVTARLAAGGGPDGLVLTFSGDDAPQSGPCDARAAHGYFGLDAEVVTEIAKWITASPRP